MSADSLEAAITSARWRRRVPSQRPGAAAHLPGAARVQQLAQRADLLARDLRAARPVTPHDRPVPQRSGRPAGCSSASPSTASPPSRPARPSNTWPSTPTASSSATRSSFICPTAASTSSATRWFSTGSVPRGQTEGLDIELERDENSIVRTSGPPKQYRFELQGPTAAAIVEDVTGRELPDVKFFNMTSFEIAGLQGRRAAPRHGGPTRIRAVRPLGAGRADPRGAAGRRRGVRTRPGRLAGVLHRQPRVGLGAGPVRRDLLRRRDEGLPRVAAGAQGRLARRQPLFRGRRRLLPDALRARLREGDRLRSRLRRPRGARSAGRCAAHARR